MHNAVTRFSAGTRLTYRTHNCDGLKCDWERPACISYYHSVPDDRSSKLETIITLQVSLDWFYKSSTAETKDLGPTLEAAARALYLPPFNENSDKMEVYLERFERFAKNNNW